MTMRPCSVLIAALAASAACPPVLAAVATIESAYVDTVTVTADDGVGGCMAALSVDPATLLPGCAANWVTFSCTGEFTNELRAWRLLDQAQLALAHNKRVQVTVDGDQKHNGYCFATRIDVAR